MSTPHVSIPGYPYHVIVEFPWAQGVVFRIRLMNEKAVQVQAWERQASPDVMRRWGHLIGPAQFFLNRILNG